MKRLACAVLALALVATAGLAAVRHKENLAAAEATAVLDLVYVKHDFAKAHGRLHPDLRTQLSKEELSKLSAIAESRLGPTKKLELDSFLPALEEKQLTVFINGVNEKGTAYHRVQLIGDAAGYKVRNLFVQGAPYPPDKGRQAFKKS
jgi:hypothetical protein